MLNRKTIIVKFRISKIFSYCTIQLVLKRVSGLEHAVKIIIKIIDIIKTIFLYLIFKFNIYPLYVFL